MDLFPARLKTTVMALLLASSLGGCATTQIERAWVEPTATARSFELKKIVVVALARDGAIRRSTEDALARAIRSGPRGQAGSLVVDPAYRLLETSDLADVAKAREKVEAAGYDGAVLIRYVSSEKEVTIEPPTYRGGFWGGYGYGGRAAGMMYDPGSVRTDTILKLQIDIYSLAAEKLLWSGVSRTLNPRDLDRLIEDIAEAVRADLQKRGFAP